MDENLLGYLLNSLDQTTHDRVESQLRTDPQTRQRLERLRDLLAPLEEDRDISSPPDLVFKTLAHVAEHCCRELPHLPQPAMPRSGSVSAPFWRRTDFIVAASLLFAAVTLSFPLVARWRYISNVEECKKNLSEFHQAMTTYKDVQRKLPNFAAMDAPRNVAGMIAPILNDAHVLDSASICCPATNGFVPCTTTLAQVGALTDKEFQLQAPRLLPCYAFSLGYYDENHAYHCAMEPNREMASGQLPLMADRPPPSGMGNSLNHLGRGQNVLFHDGHVEFCIHRLIGGDDIYLNRDMKVAAGVGCNDAVLGSSAARPFP